MKNAMLLMFSLALMGHSSLAQGPGTTSTRLLAKPAAGMPTKEIAMHIVEYQPGASDPIHRHDAQAMVYVLEGSVVMQVDGGAPATLKAGQAFYESPGDVHTVAKNASQTEKAKFVVFFLKDKGTPTFIPVK
jgi:quercetin dioxygenase-like cupin family protein